jgi:small subunit ribosomal protein S8
MSDPLADLLTRIRNGQRVLAKSVKAPDAKLHRNVLDVLKREGYIEGYMEEELRAGVRELTVELRYSGGEPVVKEIRRVSKPGRRVYTSARSMPLFYNGLGVSILSTSRGVMSDHEARAANVGGEVLCSVF